MFGRLLGWYTIYTFLEVLAPNGILPAAKFTLRPSLVFSYIGRVTALHSSSGHQPNCSIQPRVPPTFGSAAITFGIGPYSSLLCVDACHAANDKIWIAIYWYKSKNLHNEINCVEIQGKSTISQNFISVHLFSSKKANYGATHSNG